MRKLNLDRDKATALAAAGLEALREREPELVAALSRRVGSETAWRVRADLIEGDRVVLSIVAGRGEAVVVDTVHRSAVEDGMVERQH